jgi:hypothetical protein
MCDPVEPNGKTKLFEQSPGNFSYMRFQCFLAFLAAVGFGVMELKAKVGFPYLTTMFLAAGFGGKAAQKFAERK